MTTQPILSTLPPMITALAYFAIFIFAVDAQIYPSIITEVTRSPIGQGLILASSYLLFPVTSVAAGYVADRTGKHVVLSIGAVVMAVPFVLGGFLPLLQLRIVFALAFGIGGGIIEGQTSALLTDLHPDRERAVMNISQVFFCLGAAGGPFLISLLYRFIPGLTVRSLLLGFGFTSLVLFPLFLLLGFYNRGEKMEHPAAPMKSLFSNKTFRLMCLSIFLYVSAEIGTAGWLARYGVEHLGMSLQTAPLLITFFWIGLGITRFIVGVVPLKITNFNLVTICLSSALVFQLLTFIFLNKYFVFISITLLGCSLGTIWPTLVSIAGKYFRDKSGSAVGLMVASGAMGIPIISLVVSGLSSIPFLRLRGTLLLLSLLLAANIVLVQFIRKTDGVSASPME